MFMAAFSSILQRIATNFVYEVTVMPRLSHL